MPIRFGGHCCCDRSCPIFSDDFERADSSTIGNGWTENAGAWEILTGELKTASTSARVTNSAAVPAGVDGLEFSGRMKGDTSGDKLRLHINGATNYLELTVGTGTLELFIAGSSVRSCSVTAAAGSFHTLAVSICNTYTHVGAADTGPAFKVFLNDTLVMFGQVTFSYPTTVGGFGTGSAVTSAAYFDDFAINLLRDINERQTVSRSLGTLTGGTWDIGNLPGALSLTGIAYNVSAATLTSSLEGVLGASNVVATGAAFPYVITFQGTLASTDHAMITADGTNLVGTGTTLSVAETRKGYDCPQCQQCHFVMGSAEDGWNSVQLVIADAADQTATGCAALNSTYTLDQMTSTECTSCTSCETCHAACRCYGLDGLSITLTNAGEPGGGHTIQKLRFCDGVLVLIDDTNTAVVFVYFGLNAASNNRYPICSDGVSLQATAANSFIFKPLNDCTGWTFTVSDGG